MNVLDYIPEGHDSAVSLNQLQKRIGFSTREIRKAIELCNCDSDTPPVVNLMDGAGYFVPTEDEVDSVRQYIISEKSRARKIERKVRKLEKYLSNINQLEMEFTLPK